MNDEELIKELDFFINLDVIQDSENHELIENLEDIEATSETPEEGES